MSMVKKMFKNSNDNNRFLSARNKRNSFAQWNINVNKYSILWKRKFILNNIWPFTCNIFDCESTPCANFVNSTSKWPRDLRVRIKNRWKSVEETSTFFDDETLHNFLLPSFFFFCLLEKKNKKLNKQKKGKNTVDMYMGEKHVNAE